MAEDFKNFIIRLVEPDDSQRLWQIRNHAKIRQASLDKRLIPFAEHVKWFENKYFKSKDNFCYVLVLRSKVIGYCRLDWQAENDAYRISIALDADYHGRGLGRFFLSQVLSNYKQPKKILAEIIKNNLISIKLFQKNNFKIYQEDNENYYLKYQP